MQSDLIFDGMTQKSSPRKELHNARQAPGLMNNDENSNLSLMLIIRVGYHHFTIECSSRANCVGNKAHCHTYCLRDTEGISTYVSTISSKI